MKQKSSIFGTDSVMLPKRMFKTLLATLFTFYFITPTFSQQFKAPYKLGSAQSFVKTMTEREKQETFTITISSDKSFIINVESNTSKTYEHYLFGSVEGYENATFYILGNDQKIKGKLLNYDNKKAFTIDTDDENQVFIKEVDINKQVCIMDGWLDNEKSKKNNVPKQKNGAIMNIPQLQSLPGATGVLYLDFDGEFVSGGSWGTIDAQTTNYTEADMRKVWYMMAEDFIPYNINVTTERSVYDNASTNSRQMVVFNETYPQQGGVAEFNTFSGGNSPCWVNTTGLIDSVWLAANVGSHELGHTFGLEHDGTNSGDEYWLGHADYNVIMGRCNRVIAQWSKGEYQDANNMEDDIAIIENANSVDFRTDDHGNDEASSSDLVFNASDGTVLEDDNFGIIEKRTDKDYFKVNLSAGTIDLNFRPANEFPQSPNLDIQVRLLDATGNQVAISDPNEMTASLNEAVTEGIYYIEIDGVGFGDPLTNGYSDYASLGQYFISGSIPANSLSTEEYDLASTTIYPNPSSGLLTVDFDTSRTQRLKIELMDVLGKRVYINLLTPTNKTLNLGSLQKGMYFALFTEGNKSFVKKIILK